MTTALKSMTAFDADETEALRAIGWKPATDHSVCPDSSLLLAAEEGVLDDAVAERVRAHVRSCATCQLLTKDLAAVLAEESTPEERVRIRGLIETRVASRGRWPWWIAAAGALATAAALAVSFVPWQSLRSGLPPIGEPGRIGAKGAAAPTVFVGSRPVIARPEPELTLRGENAPVALAEQIGRALDAADSGDTTAAVAQLKEIVRRHESSADAHLALGATLLRMDRAAEAVPALERAKSLAGATASDEFDWFLGAALARAHETTRARVVLEPLCRRNTLRGATACAGLAELTRNAR